MALTPSTMLPLGTLAPDFSLLNTEGKIVSLSDFADCQAMLVMFICNHCPYVKHIAPELARLGKDYQSKNVGMVAIMSNDVQTNPLDSPEKMKEEKDRQGYVFDYLYDPTQEVAKAYTAACTPDFFLFDETRKLVYRGQLDDTRPTRIASGHYEQGPTAPHGKDLRAALDAVLRGQPPIEPQFPSIGCNIKWKPQSTVDPKP